MSFKENPDLNHCYSPNLYHLTAKIPVESDVNGKTTPGPQSRKLQTSLSRLQSFKENQEVSSCSSPKSSDASVVLSVEGEPGLKEGDTNINGKQHRRYEFSARNFKYWALVLLTSLILTVSFISAALLGRFYFGKGGSSLWLYTLSQTVGFPLTGAVMVGIRLAYQLNYSVTLYALAAYLVLGIIAAIDNVFYSWSVYYLPISTVGLLGATHVGFTSIFAYLLVKKKLTPFSLNCVILVTLSAVILELASDSDHTSESQSKERYLIGFTMSILANLLFGLLLPLMELIFEKLEHTRLKREAKKSSRQFELEHDQNCSEDKYLEVYIMLEMHTYSNAFASAVVVIGLLASGDCSTLKKEMHSFEGGVGIYWLTFLFGAVGWQVTALTTLGIIVLTSSLFAGVLNTLNLPFLASAAVIFFGDKFGGLKVTAMIVSLWGFVSYIYGGYLDSLQTCQD